MRKPAMKSKPAPVRAPAPGAARPRIPVWLPAVLLALVTVALYWPATSHDFVNYDDDLVVTSNVHVQNGLTPANIKWAFLNPMNNIWHPLTVLSHMLDCQLFGLNPWGHHLTSVLLHALNAALVFVLLQKLTGAIWRSLLVAALFGLHPLHVESVAWVAERKDVLSTCFGLLSLIFYARYAQRRSSAERRASRAALAVPSLVTRHSSLDYVGALFFFAFGLMSKPMLVTWPFVMLLLDYWPLKRFAVADLRFTNSRSLPSLLLEKIPFFALAALASIVTFVVQKQTGALVAVEKLPLGARSGNALISYCRYLGKLFWPADLAVYYPHPGYWPLAEVLLAGLLLVVISVLTFAMRRQYPFLLMGWLWFVGTLVPVIQLVQTGSHAMADRYAYIPSLGILILTIWGVCELARRWRYYKTALSVMGCTAIVLCLGLTRQQLGYWQDTETLFRHALEVTDKNFIAHNSLGVTLDRKGQIDEAIRQFQAAIRLKPDYPNAHNNLGVALGRKGQTDDAISQYQEAIRLKPDYAEFYYNLGAALDKKGQNEEAINQFQAAIRLKPDYADAYNDLGAALDRKGQVEEAINQFQAAIRLKPDYAEAHNNLGVALGRKGQSGEAISQFQAAIRLKPDYADAYNNLGCALAAQGRFDEATGNYRKATRINANSSDALDNLGVALAVQGRFDEAIENYYKVIQIDSNRPETFFHLGTTLGQLGRNREAVAQYREALRLNPNLSGALNNLGVALAAQGQFDEAIENYRKAIQINTNNCEALDNLGKALAAQGRFDEAIESFYRAIQINSNHPEIFFHLGMILDQSGRNREAVAQYREALRLNPNLSGALNNLAWVLATSPDEKLRNGAEAVRLAERACELTHDGQPAFVGTLAAAYAEAGRFPEAVTTAEKAEQLATAAGLKKLAVENQKLLELYQAGKPCRGPAQTGH